MTPRCRRFLLLCLACSVSLGVFGPLTAPERLRGLFVRDAAGASAGMLSSDGSPAAEADGLYHWPRLPVRLFIAAGNDRERRWARIAAAGFDEWGRATGGAVGYTRAASPAEAQITVRFVPTPAVPGHPDLVGLTTIFWVGPVLQSANVVLAAGGKSAADLQTAAAHELGHALGIREHSDDPDDLMCPAPIRPLPDGKGAPPASAHPVTARDLDTLKLCYPALFARK